MNIKIVILVLLIMCALFLRVWKVGEFPVSLYGDEESFAWNAWNILKTGADEFGTPYPLQFRAFDDYKAPIPVYLLVPVFGVFGMNPDSIRIPISVASVLTIIAIYALSRRFFDVRASLLISFTIAISAWDIHLSRGYFEATLSLLFLVSALYFFLGNKIRDQLLNALFFSLSVYTYFTPRLFLIFMLPLLLVWKLKVIRNKKEAVKKVIISYGILFLISIPLLYQTFFGYGLSRFSKLLEGLNTRVVQTIGAERQTSSLSEFVTRNLVNKATVSARFIIQGYLEHFSFNFYFVNADTTLRYFTGDRGLLYLFDLPFLIAGLYKLWRYKRNAFYFIFIWLLTAPIPASIVGRPFSLRSLAMAPPLWIIIGYGIYSVFQELRNKKIKYIFSVIITGIAVFSLLGWLIRYFYFYPKLGATWWGGINKIALEAAFKEQDKYTHIFLSDYYSGMPLSFAVYTQADPRVFRQAVLNPVVLADGRHLIKLGKFYFGSLDIDKTRMNKNIIPVHSLYFARPEEAVSEEAIHAPDDGRVLFYVYRN
ncbi:hypothetical protein A3D77_07240 [Candidatus Gottesmanbacteria bacterium RIFCSPHIGHO2_02_FULL_39_11]|uniref:Glycosyltransferase RgtA/B/C/D-like domain-containing protein n=1 Tax=Candidatus Gottesmanbacteria bacterium RIFCSPHIGHO2_02_FULL_39_11 TaxID=1798382 RepID=A0A1F5ZKD2_9BACT|nr:MAG: hypothetical protein A3D77_07240 [Candidatus Gottesmanbacteria bacterium RIFCSPHIGHO2_02_FULL_39_11]